jgi:hypothetical protein
MPVFRDEAGTGARKGVGLSTAIDDAEGESNVNPPLNKLKSSNGGAGVAVERLVGVTGLSCTGSG